MLFNKWLNDESKIILFDGAMGTEIIKRGIEPGKLPDILNIEQPDVISEIHKGYYEAGADMCQTCTFGATELNLHKYKLDNRIEEINKSALANIKKICPPDHLIVGDIGPSGEFRPPVGTASSENWQSSFEKQVSILEKDVDLFHIETMSDIQEMQAAIRGIKKFSKKPIIASMTYKSSKRGFYTIMGDSLKKCVQILEKENVDVIGSNCTLGSEEMIELLRETLKITEKPLSVKPNAGQPVIDEDGKTSYKQPIKDFANDIKEMIELGAKIVGGCCGTTSETIHEIRKIIDAR
ncbi:MAG: homocysteine S-methyltransferase family protein [Promethearchaeota archaeon]